VAHFVFDPHHHAGEALTWFLFRTIDAYNVTSHSDESIQGMKFRFSGVIVDRLVSRPSDHTGRRAEHEEDGDGGCQKARESLHGWFSSGDVGK